MKDDFKVHVIQHPRGYGKAFYEQQMKIMEEKNIRLSNIYRVTYKKWLLLKDERDRHRKIINIQNDEISRLKKKVKELEKRINQTSN